MRRRLAISAAVVGALAAFLACNGGASGPETPGAPGATPTIAPGGTTPAAQTPAAEPPERSARLTVNSTGDEVAADGALTLREAIAVATGELGQDELDQQEQRQVTDTPGFRSADTIQFDPGVFPEEQPATIELLSTLPVLKTGFDIVDGSGAGVIVLGTQRQFPCFHVDSPGNALRGLVVEECHTAVLLDYKASGNLIGGKDEGHRNVLSGNLVGIEIRGSGNRVQGNYIGLDPTGERAAPNAFEGIWIAPGGKDNLIGGAEDGEGNVISGNELFGVSVDGQGTTGNLLQGNFIGTDPTGLVAIANRYGVAIQGGAQGNTIGGQERDEGNVISGNNTGVLFRHEGTTGNSVRGNFIGYARDGDTIVENVVDIWTVDGAEGNPLEGNVIKEGT